MYWFVIFLAIAISIDGFAVGVTYGLKKIKFNIVTLLIISSISTLLLFLTGSIGFGIMNFLDEKVANVIGGIILLVMGIWLVYTNYLPKESANGLEEKKLIVSFKIKFLGIIINILKEPMKADFDKSGTINYSEAIFLGLALALDAMGAGLGAGLVGTSMIIFPIVIGIMNFVFISMGFFIGKRFGSVLPQYFDIFPGLIIIILGISKIILC